VIVVFNDASLSLIDVKQKQCPLPPGGVRIGAVDWCRLAAGVGMHAASAATDAALADAVSDALDRDGPSLIDARIDPTSYPATLKAVRG
jgi:acetolactate synthase-1/2/3 large subunit